MVVVLANPIGVLTACALRGHPDHSAAECARPATGKAASLDICSGRPRRRPARRRGRADGLAPQAGCRPGQTPRRKISGPRTNVASWAPRSCGLQEGARQRLECASAGGGLARGRSLQRLVRIAASVSDFGNPFSRHRKAYAHLTHLTKP